MGSQSESKPRSYTRGVSSRILAYMSERPNRRIPIESIEKATGYTREQIRNGVVSLSRNGVKIESMLRGSVFVFTEDEPTSTAPVATTTSTNFSSAGVHVVGHLADGSTIFELSDGTVWLATRIK